MHTALFPALQFPKYDEFSDLVIEFWFFSISSTLLFRFSSFWLGLWFGFGFWRGLSVLSKIKINFRIKIHYTYLSSIATIFFVLFEHVNQHSQKLSVLDLNDLVGSESSKRRHLLLSSSHLARGHELTGKHF